MIRKTVLFKPSLKPPASPGHQALFAGILMLAAGVHTQSLKFTFDDPPLE